MQDGKITIVRKCYDALARGDSQAMLSCVDQSVEIHDHYTPDRSSLRGHDGFMTAIRTWTAQFSDMKIEPEDLEQEHDRVLVRFRLVGRGRGSGVQTEIQLFHVWRLVDGKIAQLDVYGDAGAARAALE
jgi:ketosteroid isomerase-like protein